MMESRPKKENEKIFVKGSNIYLIYREIFYFSLLAISLTAGAYFMDVGIGVLEAFGLSVALSGFSILRDYIFDYRRSARRIAFRMDEIEVERENGSRSTYPIRELHFDPVSKMWGEEIRMIEIYEGTAKRLGLDRKQWPLEEITAYLRHRNLL